jgi:hypothetical protein
LAGGAKLCFDADALIHLLGIDCLGPAIECLGGSPESCSFMPSVLGRIRSKKWLAERWPRADPDDLRACIERMAPVGSPRDLSLQEALNINDIEPGDAALIALLFETKDLLLVTGDGRMIRALYSAPASLDHVKEAVRGRFVLFPQLLPEIARRITLLELERKVRSSQTLHKGLRIIFGGRTPTPQEEFLSACEMQVARTIEVCGRDVLYLL